VIFSGKGKENHNRRKKPSLKKKYNGDFFGKGKAPQTGKRSSSKNVKI
jgi:hypothetical protein